MNRARLPRLAIRALLCAALLAPAGGCTLFDDYLPGTPFTPDQPAGEVTLQGVIHVDPVGRDSETCPPGGSVLWGYVRNTGDLDLDEVEIVIDVFGHAGEFLGAFQDHVFNGEIIAGADEDSLDSASTSLDVDQSGAFQICTPLPAGAIARTEHRTEFVILETSEI